MIKKKILLLPFFILFSLFNVFAKDYYWDEPKEITSVDSRFPVAVSCPSKKINLNHSVNVTPSAIIWEEVDSARKRLYLSARTTSDGKKWREIRRFSAPINYSGQVPDLYSAAISENGTICIVAITGETELTAYLSTDGKSFQSVVLPKFSGTLIAPRVYASSNNSFTLFTSLGKNESFNLLYCRSKDGINWSSFQPFTGASGTKNPFVPCLVTTGGQGELVLFQSQVQSTSRLSYQLFSTYSSNEGKTWSSPYQVTSAESLGTSLENAANYNNQRPSLLWDVDKIFLAWERTWYASENSSIWFTTLSKEGKIISSVEQLTNGANASRPVLFSYDDFVNCVWFDNRSGTDKIYLSKKTGSLWNEMELSTSHSQSTFASPVLTQFGTQLSFVWQEVSSKDKTKSRIFMLEADKTSPPPMVTPRFTEGKKYSAENAAAEVRLSADPSGVAGYSWIWTQNISEEPPLEINAFPEEKVISAKAVSDGDWYFRVKQRDYAGNWSETTTVTYTRDLTPPGPPVIYPPEIDSYEFVKSNTFTLEWEPNPYDDDVAGYSWSLEFIADLPQELSDSKYKPLNLPQDQVYLLTDSLKKQFEKSVENVLPPAKTILGSQKSVSYSNRKNGYYVFSLCAIDACGNIGQPAKTTLLLNKYIPQTYVRAVNAKTDEDDVTSISLFGSGFTYDGKITSVYIDKDGLAPYDYSFNLNSGFKINSDSKISGINIKELAPGTYRIGLLHSQRGLYLSAPMFTVTDRGTIKYETQYFYEPEWQSYGNEHKFNFNLGAALLWTAFILALLLLFVSLRGLGLAAKESITVKKEVIALITGDIMPMEKKIKSKMYKKKGTSLRVKITAFTIALVVAIVAMVSLPLGFIMLKTQERTLSSGLFSRVSVLLDSLSTGAKAYLPTQDILQLSYLPEQTQALPEAQYATITGFGESDQNVSLNYIWATNDENILSKTDSKTLSYGQSRLVDDSIGIILEKCQKLDKEAQAQVAEISQSISELNREGVKLALKTDNESVARREEISEITTNLNNRLNSTLNNLSTQGIGSYPSYDSSMVDRKNTSYVFYKPVLYRQGSDQTFVHGIIFVEVHTQSLITELNLASRTILFTALGIALIAILIGFFGSMLISAVVIKPVKKLADHVAMIRDTQDKEELAGKEITVTSNDEIGLLGDTVNEMTRGLVQAAQATKNLIVGKDIQTKFIPLKTDKNGNTLTTGSLHAQGADFFSYYAGADELSGDYFDYRQIDETHYAIIKCDVSGHGVPAALIMVEVATLFLNYFTNWNMKKTGQGINLAPVVGKINDLLESRGFKGRFAAFTLCILDTQSGEAWFCNAGDNLVQIYDSALMQKKTIKLQETPAAGMFPTDLIEMKGGYQVSKLTLKKGDVLFLYTDGIEEAKRKFRDKDCNETVCMQEGLKEGEEHFTHVVGEASEEMTAERVSKIIESVYARTSYELKKYHSPDESEQFIFDFSTCEGSAEDAVMALVSVEKIFRMYKPQVLKGNEKVKVDRTIDDFLKKHFVQYKNYCSSKEDIDADENNLYYRNVCEDGQYDDLTLVAIKKL